MGSKSEDKKISDSTKIYQKDLRKEMPAFKSKYSLQKNSNTAKDVKREPVPMPWKPVNQIDHILVVSSNKAWISEGRHLALVKANGKIEKHIKLDFDIQGLEFNQSHDLVVETAMGIQKVTEKGKFVHFENDKNVTIITDMYTNTQNSGESNNTNVSVLQSNFDVTNNVSVISKFEHSTNIDTIAAANDNTAWIGKGTIIELVKTNGEVERSINLGFKLSHMALTNTGNLLISSGQQLKSLVTETGQITDFGKTFDCVISGLAVTLTNEILVCLDVKVVRLSSDGEIVQTIQYDKTGALIFIQPSYITQTNTGNIWVSDFGTEANCVTVVNNGGEFQFKYSGPSNNKLENSFRPNDLISNQYGKVLISDYNNDAIHLVDQDGHFVQFLLTKDNGIIKPYILSQDKDGTLWVGCSNHTIIVATYLDKDNLITTVNKSGCNCVII